MQMARISSDRRGRVNRASPKKPPKENSWSTLSAVSSANVKAIHSEKDGRSVVLHFPGLNEAEERTSEIAADNSSRS